MRDAAKPFDGGTKATFPEIIRETLIDILSDTCEGFLDGLTSEWVLIERERFFNLQIRGLSLLMHDLAESGRIRRRWTMAAASCAWTRCANASNDKSCGCTSSTAIRPMPSGNTWSALRS